MRCWIKVSSFAQERWPDKVAHEQLQLRHGRWCIVLRWRRHLRREGLVVHVVTLVVDAAAVDVIEKKWIVGIEHSHLHVINWSDRVKQHDSTKVNEENEIEVYQYFKMHVNLQLMCYVNPGARAFSSVLFRCVPLPLSCKHNCSLAKLCGQRTSDRRRQDNANTPARHTKGQNGGRSRLPYRKEAPRRD